MQTCGILLQLRWLDHAVIGKKRRYRKSVTCTKPRLFHLFAAMDAPIRRLTAEKDDLETVFLEATAG